MTNLFRKLRRARRKIGRQNTKAIDPDEIFLDSSNLPHFDTHHFEGRIEKPISTRTIVILSVFFIVIAGVFSGRLWILQIKRGEAYSVRSESNRLRFSDIFANRGVIFDRNGFILASNKENTVDAEFAMRTYSTTTGIGSLIGYLKYPTKDAHGFYYRKSFEGQDGVESNFSDELSGVNGLKVIETDAHGEIQSESVTRVPEDGNNITLSIDSKLQSKLYEIIKDTASERQFGGGVAVIMDVRNGELLSLVSFPEYSSQAMTDGDSEKIKKYLNDSNKPFLNRAVSGLYTPGSIIKPILALAALEEKVIDPKTQILSTGSISLPNPYFPDKKSVFMDWKAHGYVDMRKAIAVSSDVYFYEIGGGFENQKGLGIDRIEKYVRAFGLGKATGINLPNEQGGVIPTPEWKEKAFPGDPWRIGNTYHSSIGQYGFQITPLQIARYVAAIANYGTLFTPTLIHGERGASSEKLNFAKENFEIVHEGMRQAVTEGTAAGLNIPSVEVAAKTGTAELGTQKKLVNSWSVGFFPYKNPHYAFAVLMERGPSQNQIGATYVMRQFLDWLSIYKPEYLKED
jgi:penicillin-binding protein 2